MSSLSSLKSASRPAWVAPPSADPERDAAILAAIEAELEDRDNSVFAYYAKWRENPLGFITDGLLGFAWSKQREIAESVRVNRRTAVQSCHDVGKDWIAAQLVAWWLGCNPPGEAMAVTIAPTIHQVRNILWREINKTHAAAGLPGRMNQIEWWLGNQIVGFGRSPADTDPDAIQGIHARRVLFVVDEANGVSKALMDAGDSLIANDESRALAIGNPDDPTSEFANICTPGSGWNVIRISAFESPNFTGEPVPESLKPLLVSKTWVEEKRKSWGAESMLWSSKVLGEFPEQAEDSLIPLSALRRAHERWSEEAWTAALGAPDNELGVDVARMGSDSTVFYRRRGMIARCVHKHRKKDLMELVGHVVRLCRIEKPKRVKIDDIGMGGGVTDRLREIKAYQGNDEGQKAAALALDGVEIAPVDVGSSPISQTADERFQNKRAELNWGMRVRLTEDGAQIALEPNDDLDAQATQIKYKIPSGEIQIEKKADMKKRTKGVSPDDWDALVLCFGELSYAGAGLMEYYRRQVAEQEANAKKPPPGSGGPPTLSTGGVRLKVPNGVSTVYGMSGRCYPVANGEIVAEADDAKPLLGQGFEKL